LNHRTGNHLKREQGMTTKNSMKLIPALVLGLFSGYASAAGFQLMEQNASGLGNAYAGSAAIADNASTIFYNPAGMTQLQAREVSGGLSAVGTSFKFSDKGSSVGLLGGSGNGNDGGAWGVVPNGYFSMALNKDLYVGVGFGAPFGLKTEYNNPWTGAAQSTMFDVKTYNINPSVAYRVSDKVSIGGGLNWQRVEAEYQRQAAVVSAVTVASPLKLTLNDDAWGWNVGALFTLSPSTRVGVSYRSAISYDTTGNINVSGPSAAFNAASSSSAKASIKLPDSFIMSVAQQLSDKWQMLGDVSWTGWSTLPKVDIIRTSGAASGTTAQTLGTDFRDTWRVALGANYKLSDAVKLKFGIAYDQTPVKGATTRLTSLPDNNRTWFSAGAQWVPTKGSAIDVGVAYLYVKDADIDNNQTPLRGRVTGTYSDSAWILGGQYSMAF
jgi:long-chain fatty acid transport protein